MVSVEWRVVWSAPIQCEYPLITLTKVRTSTSSIEIWQRFYDTFTYQSILLICTHVRIFYYCWMQFNRNVIYILKHSAQIFLYYCYCLCYDMEGKLSCCAEIPLLTRMNFFRDSLFCQQPPLRSALIQGKLLNFSFVFIRIVYIWAHFI